MTPASLTQDEVVALGINPESPFCSPRTRKDPIDIRYGDSRVVRSVSGGITHFFGYYSENQIHLRQLMAEIITKEMRLKGLFFP